MTQEKANGWVRSVVSALLAAAAAWGSVTVEINKVVDAKVEAMLYLVRKDIDQHVAMQRDSLAAMLDHRFAALIDTMASTASSGGGPAPIIRPVVMAPEAPPDTITPVVLESIQALRMEVQRLAQTVRQVEPERPPGRRTTKRKGETP